MNYTSSTVSENPYESETPELTPPALIHATQSTSLERLEAANQAKTKARPEFLHLCEVSKKLYTEDLDTFRPNLKPETRSKILLLMDDLVHRILTSSSRGARVSSELLDSAFSSHVRRILKHVLDNGRAFRVLSNATTPGQVDGKQADTYVCRTSGEVNHCPGGRSKEYTLTTPMISINATDTTDFPNVTKTRGKTAVLHQRQHVCEANGIEGVESGRQRWTTNSYRLGMVDSWTWEQYQEKLDLGRRLLGWTVIQDQISTNLGRLEFSFDSTSERDAAFEREIQRCVAERMLEFEAEAATALAEKKSKGQRGCLKRLTEAIIKRYVSSIWDSLTPLIQCIDGDGNPTVFRKLGRIYGPHTSAPRWVRNT